MELFILLEGLGLIMKAILMVEHQMVTVTLEVEEDLLQMELALQDKMDYLL